MTAAFSYQSTFSAIAGVNSPLTDMQSFVNDVKACRTLVDKLKVNEAKTEALLVILRFSSVQSLD